MLASTTTQTNVKIFYESDAHILNEETLWGKTRCVFLKKIFCSHEILPNCILNINEKVIFTFFDRDEKFISEKKFFVCRGCGINNL